MTTQTKIRTVANSPRSRIINIVTPRAANRDFSDRLCATMSASRRIHGPSARAPAARHADRADRRQLSGHPEVGRRRDGLGLSRRAPDASARRSRSRSCTPSSRPTARSPSGSSHEAKAVNAIGHPNIVDIVDYGMIQTGTSGHEQLVYFIMEYLAGGTLSQPDPRRGAARARARADDRAAGRRRARRVAQVRHRPPRSQARQHHPDLARSRARLRQAARLRHREAHRRRARLAPHAHRHRARHAGVHVARAVRRPRERRSSHRRLRARHLPVRDADRPRAVHRRGLRRDPRPAPDPASRCRRRSTG